MKAAMLNIPKKTLKAILTQMSLKTACGAVLKMNWYQRDTGKLFEL
jgi:hypothetical protein